MNFTDPLVLRSDVVLVPVTQLSAEVQARFEHEEGDYTLSRRHGRTPSQIIDRETASLLEIFRQPTTLVDAVIRNSRALSKDPKTWLDELLPHIDAFLRSQVLILAGAEEERELLPLLDTGSSVAGWTIVRCVHLMDESEIYRVRRDAVDGATKEGAMKIARVTPFSFGNEIEVLRHLDGRVGPRLLDSGEHDGRPYLITEWLEGTNATTAASFGRHDRAAMLSLCLSIAGAYADLHACGVVHADVHPSNVIVASDIVASDRSVRLIDFGLSRIDGASTRLMPRGGMYAFFEPEYLAGLRARREVPASIAGEQYAVSALLYQLIAGAHYVEFRLEREEMMRQAENEPPLPFAARGIPPWPEVEGILVRGLEKDPARRFASLRALADALRDAHPSTSDDTLSDAARQLVDDEIAALSRRAEPEEFPRPHASINYGAAGAALGLLRIAMVRDDPKLLALAEVWHSRAAAYANAPEGWYDDEDAPQAMVGDVSPYHSPAGLYAASALIAYARGDRSVQRTATQAFVAISKLPCDTLDLTLGRAGSLLAAALLRETGEEVHDLGNALVHELWEHLDALPPLHEQPRETYLGIAHGWSGYLYATLRWSLVSKTPLPPNAVVRLEELAALRIARGRGAWWPRQLGGGLHDMMPGWCNGAAGHVFTWTSAFDATRDDRWLDLAELAAWNAWEEPLSHADLCCGSAGRAYALLNLYKHTGNREWLTRARQLANHAAGAARSSAQRRHSLWKGEMGVAALIADLESPENAAMPSFENSLGVPRTRPA
jgi:serine/threonine-protein kinase